jgi:hypothetical protein
VLASFAATAVSPGMNKMTFTSSTQQHSCKPLLNPKDMMLSSATLAVT